MKLINHRTYQEFTPITPLSQTLANHAILDTEKENIGGQGMHELILKEPAAIKQLLHQIKRVAVLGIRSEKVAHAPAHYVADDLARAGDGLKERRALLPSRVVGIDATAGPVEAQD